MGRTLRNWRVPRALRTRMARPRRRVAVVLALIVVVGTSSVATTASRAAAATSQAIAAGSSSTNVPTETRWAGAQNSPYVCCWGSQGQFVTFAFSVTGGSTNLGLRYGAGNGDASRKIELDGSVWVANQTFAATANWSTWSTLTLNQPNLAAGAHTLKVWFDATAGSRQYVNLDNLTINQLPLPGAQAIAAGTSATNLPTETVWAGSQSLAVRVLLGLAGSVRDVLVQRDGWLDESGVALQRGERCGEPQDRVGRIGAGWRIRRSRRRRTWSTWSTLTLNQPSVGRRARTRSRCGSTRRRVRTSTSISTTSPSRPSSSLRRRRAWWSRSATSDGATGLTPWSGSANTVFIGEPPHCCAHARAGQLAAPATTPAPSR